MIFISSHSEWLVGHMLCGWLSRSYRIRHKTRGKKLHALRVSVHVEAVCGKSRACSSYSHTSLCLCGSRDPSLKDCMSFPGQISVCWLYIQRAGTKVSFSRTLQSSSWQPASYQASHPTPALPKSPCADWQSWLLPRYSFPSWAPRSFLPFYCI